MISSPGNEDGHYSGEYQPIDFADEFLFPEFHIGNVIKYVVRHKKKGGKQDLLKALWYLNRSVTIVEDIYIGNNKMKESIGFGIFKSRSCANNLVTDRCDYLSLDIIYSTIKGNYEMAIIKLKQKINNEYPDE